MQDFSDVFRIDRRRLEGVLPRLLGDLTALNQLEDVFAVEAFAFETRDQFVFAYVCVQPKDSLDCDGVVFLR